MESNVIFERLFAPDCGDFFEDHQAAKSLRDLDIDQMGCVEALSGVQHPLLYPDALFCAQQELEYCRRINNNQRESRSPRRMSVGESLPR